MLNLNSLFRNNSLLNSAASARFNAVRSKGSDLTSSFFEKIGLRKPVQQEIRPVTLYNNASQRMDQPMMSATIKFSDINTFGAPSLHTARPRVAQPQQQSSFSHMMKQHAHQAFAQERVSEQQPQAGYNKPAQALFSVFRDDTLPQTGYSKPAQAQFSIFRDDTQHLIQGEPKAPGVQAGNTRPAPQQATQQHPANSEFTPEEHARRALILSRFGHDESKAIIDLSSQISQIRSLNMTTPSHHLTNQLEKDLSLLLKMEKD